VVVVAGAAVVFGEAAVVVAGAAVVGAVVVGAEVVGVDWAQANIETNKNADITIIPMSFKKACLVSCVLELFCWVSIFHLLIQYWCLVFALYVNLKKTKYFSPFNTSLRDNF